MVARALGAARDTPPEDGRDRGVIARGVADRWVEARGCVRVGARRAEGCMARLRLGEAALARGCARVGARRAEGIARLRLGEGALARDGLEVRDRALGADRVTCPRCLAGAELTAPERDRTVGRGAALEGAGALDVVPLTLVGDVERPDVVARRELGVTRVAVRARSVGRARAPSVRSATTRRLTASAGRTREAR